jgi:hypothetical protein
MRIDREFLIDLPWCPRLVTQKKKTHRIGKGPYLIIKMDLFLVQHPNGMQIARGQAPLGAIAVFPGLGKHMPKVLRLLPRPVCDGVYDVSPCLALTAVGSCMSPPAPEDRIAAFLDCLYPVDKLNVAPTSCVSGLARDVFGSDYRSMLSKAGVRLMKKDKYDDAFKMLRGGKSSWIAIDVDKSWNLRRLCRGLDAPSSGTSDITD